MKPVCFDNSYARLPETFFARCKPAPVPAPTLVRLNHGLSRELALDADWLASDAGLAMLAGNVLPDSADPISMAYGGHQFGGWSPRLGDGRALLLGEVIGRNGLRRDLQLKGSGRTPFSRGGDGKATLGAILREYVLSEAMFALGVPTTRALAMITTGEQVYRESPVPGAILTRVAQSHVRVGTFEYFVARDDHESLRTLADYVIDRHYPQARDATNPYQALLVCVIERQAELIARWMQLGFIHGVMNTDNMQVVGETIDYGPCAFMDEFHPKCVFSSIDRLGRYAWDRQPAIAKWNLTRFAEALLSSISFRQQTAVAMAEEALARFEEHFNGAFLDGFRRKLGLVHKDEKDPDYISATFSALAQHEVDFTLFFRQLTNVAAGQEEEVSLVRLFKDPQGGHDWLATWRHRLQRESSDAQTRVAIMRGVNPIFVPRNHRVEEAIQHAIKGDFASFERLVSVLSNPYGEQPENSEYENAPRPDEKVHETFCGT